MALQLATKLLQNDKSMKARKLFEHALILDPYNADLLLEYGQFLESYHQDFIRAESFYTRALIKQPRNSRALQLQQRTMPVVEELDQKTFRRIDDLLKEFYRRSKQNPWPKHVQRHAYYLQVYHSNAIEGNTLTFNETRTIIRTRRAIGGKSLIEQQEVIGLDAALQYVNSTLVNRFSSITRDDILEIHRRVLGFVNPMEAGRFRQHQVYVGSFVPPTASEISAYFDEFLHWLNSRDTRQHLHVIELAAMAHYKFVYIHPFIDGNGRTGRLLMNLIFMRSGFPPVLIKFQQRLIYYAHLDQANTGHIRPLIRFIAQCTEQTLTEFMNRSRSNHQQQAFDFNDDQREQDDAIEEQVIRVK
jgi:Fic family protein